MQDCLIEYGQRDAESIIKAYLLNNLVIDKLLGRYLYNGYGADF